MIQNLQSKDTRLIELVQVYKNAIPVTIRNSILEKSLDYKWINHHSHFRAPVDKTSALELSPIIENYLKNYLSSHVALDLRIAKISPLEINKYPTDTEMFFHTDHDSAGFPFLTMIASMNDNFDGGEFVLWDDEVVKLEAGDLLLFPSMFAYPHRITKITKGTRYSVISWAY